MAEDASQEDRTVDPSAKRLAEARRTGNVPRSRQLDHALLLGAGALGLTMLGPSMADAAIQLFRGALRFDLRAATEPARMLDRFEHEVLQMLLACAPFVALLMVAAVVAPLAVGGWNFTSQAFEPKLDRFDPIAGIARLVSARAWVELAKTLLVVIVGGTVGYLWFTAHVEQFAALATVELHQATAMLGGTTLQAFVAMVGVLVVIAAVDVPWQLHSYKKQLMMTPEEAKREAKEAESSPEVKGKLRARARELARRRMMQAVPQASVVVTNPTHYAVALQYDDTKHAAPVVVAKGTDEVAAKIREIAAASKVPLLSAPPLARALHQHVEIGDAIPAPLYAAVAAVLAYVFQLNHAVPGAAAPREPTDLPVPPELDPLAVAALAAAAAEAAPGTAHAARAADVRAGHAAADRTTR